MNHLYKSKWTSTQNLNGWRHYEVLNIFKKINQVEMFCVCDFKIKQMVPIQDLKDISKWTPGWISKNNR